LTGPIYIEEAQPGDVLKVTLNKIVPRAYATNFNVPGMFGQFPNVYQDGQVKYLYLDLDKMTTEFLPGVVMPLQPFPARSRSRARSRAAISSVPPGEYRRQHGHPRLRRRHDRSMCRCMCRARCCGPAIRMPARATARSTSPRSRPPTRSSTSRWSRQGQAARLPAHRDAEILDHDGLRPGPQQGLGAGQGADRQVPLRAAQRLRRASREADASVSDCRVSQVVNVKKGIHCLNPKNARDKEDMERPTKETRKYYVSHVKDADLNKAMNDASMGMIKLLESEKKIARLDAYGLASVAMDCRVGAISDTEKNVHCLMPKSIWVRAPEALARLEGPAWRGPSRHPIHGVASRSHRRCCLASPGLRRIASRS
jgi:acetamidase/formamidase